ncbi:MAG TPA: TonB-dependent receptor [Vicinamibacterales bacterium]|nr:TonB-dependent receptor [Vicinamibacterales bacterium]
MNMRVRKRGDRFASAGRRLLALAAAALLAAASPLRAQDRAPQAPDGSASAADDSLLDLGLEDLLNIKVYAASRFVQEVAQAPASVTIVASDEIRRHGYRTLADILRGVRGFYVTDDRDYSYVGVRGFLRPGDYNGRVLLLVNGHRLNDTIFEQAAIGTESAIDVSLIDRVEVIRGPSSSLYGTSAFFAVVNVITRGGRAVSGVTMEGETGSQKFRRGRFAAGGRNARGFEGLFSIAAHGSDGNDAIYYPGFDTPDENHGVAVDADRDRSASIFASGTAGGFTAQIGFGSRTKTIPTAPYDTRFNDPRTRTRDARGFADVHYTRRLDPRTTLELKGAYDQYDYQGQFAYDAGLFHDDAHGAWLTGEATLVRQMGSHALTVGTELRHNIRQNQSADDASGVLLDDQRHSQTAALFAEDEYRVSNHVLINAGVRWDEYFGIFGGTVNPRVGLIVTAWEGSAIKALYGRAFRAPNPFELYYDHNAISAKLQPERIQTFEVAVEQRLSPRLQASASIFRNQVSDLISQRSGSDTLDGLYYANGDGVTADGVEFELLGELPGRIHARLAQALQSARLDSPDRAISNSPNALTTIVLDAPIPKTDVVAAFNGYYIGERHLLSDGIVGSAFVANLSISRRIERAGLGVGFTLYNVFGAEYGDPGSSEHRQDVLPRDGRTGAVRVSWKF